MSGRTGASASPTRSGTSIPASRITSYNVCYTKLLRAAEIAGGRPVAPLRLLTLAAYVPLNSIAGIERALERSWPQPVADVLQQQITEPRSEQALLV